MAAKGIKYTETNSATITDESFAGTTQEITVIAIPEKAEGDTEQEKIDNALANPNKSEPSEPITVTFPMKPPAKPTGLKNENTAYNKTDLTWTAPANAQSYTLTQDGKVIKYLETNKITLTDEAFAGKTIKFSVTAYPRKYTGKDEQEKINNAVNSKEGSPKSDDLSVVFPAKPPEKPGTPGDFKSSDLTYNSVKFTWAAPAKALSYLLYKDGIAIQYKETLVATVTGDELAGTTAKFKLVAFNEKFTGADEAAKIKSAEESKRGGDPTSELSVTFPAKEDELQNIKKTVKK